MPIDFSQQPLPLGDDHTGMLLRILRFNLGVDIGQVAVLTVIVGLRAFWRDHPSSTRFGFAANPGLIDAGVYWLFMQLHGYQHDASRNTL
ncbi:MAG: HupE/UreJ family protein [Lacisediminimonas sp.]|nr:HupE/UreJ family protein [Lacisediminimonas sp.]